MRYRGEKERGGVERREDNLCELDGVASPSTYIPSVSSSDRWRRRSASQHRTFKKEQEGREKEWEWNAVHCYHRRKMHHVLLYILLFSLVLHRRLFCYAQPQQHQQSDDILLPTLCSENNEGYKRDDYFRLFALQKYQLRDETVKSIFGRKKQRKGRSVIYFGTHVSRETFFVFVLARWRFEPLSLFLFFFLPWLREM